MFALRSSPASRFSYGIGKWRLIQKDPELGAVLRQRSNVDLKVRLAQRLRRVVQRWTVVQRVYLCLRGQPAPPSLRAACA